MDPETVDLETAVKLLLAAGRRRTATAPRSCANGRYGPYLRKGTDGRVDSEDRSSACELPRRGDRGKPKLHSGQRVKPPLAKLGDSHDTGTPVRVLDGRFGPTSRTARRARPCPRRRSVGRHARKGVELLRERGKGPAKKKTAKRPAKKAARRSRRKTTKDHQESCAEGRTEGRGSSSLG
jgi:DNA topoisomerase-1